MLSKSLRSYSHDNVASHELFGFPFSCLIQMSIAGVTDSAPTGDDQAMDFKPEGRPLERTSTARNSPLRLPRAVQVRSSCKNTVKIAQLSQ
jgi:hypothetical protein